MKDLKHGFAKWLVLVTTTLIVIGLFTLVAKCQVNVKAPAYYIHEDDAHKDFEDLEEDIRFKYLMVIAVEPTTIFWKKESRNIVNTGSFNFDDRSKVEKNIKKGCYIAIYCVTHNYLYALYPCKE